MGEGEGKIEGDARKVRQEVVCTRKCTALLVGAACCAKGV
jgi:hypothetical protein